MTEIFIEKCREDAKLPLMHMTAMQAWISMQLKT